jgi:NADP-dependent 3-hydroxy acid dehydrogenase YdfG
MKNILITGGSSGIGYELVKLFSTHCIWHVVTCSRSGIKNQMLSSTLECVNASTVDLGDPIGRKHFLDQFIDSHSSLDALILNAAVTGVSYIDQKEHAEDYVREVNIQANKDILDKTLPLLRKSNGIVVFISTAIFEEKDRDPAIDLYAQTKKEFEEYFAQCSKLSENSGVRFIIFRPGMTATRVHENILQIGKGKLFERTKEGVSNHRLNSPHVVAKAIKHYVEHPENVHGLVMNMTPETYSEHIQK